MYIYLQKIKDLHFINEVTYIIKYFKYEFIFQSLWVKVFSWLSTYFL
jgi:hypothetical protein